MADHTQVEILRFIDDHSRYALSATARRRVTGPTVVAEFREAGTAHGIPASRAGNHSCLVLFCNRIFPRTGGLLRVQKGRERRDFIGGALDGHH